ncbi:MAG: branched-chain amino acid ABC transporter permease [Sphaerochaetaceae bacterium]
MDKWITAVIYGLGQGGILFLVSLALSIGYGLMRVVNMESMLYYTFGAYVSYTIMKVTGNFFFGALCAFGIGAILGFIVETQLLRRLYHKEMMFTVSATYSVFLIGIGFVQFIWGLNPKPVAMPIDKMVRIIGVSIPVYRVIVFIVAAVVYVLITLMLNRTIAGKAIMAGVDSRPQVEALGINVNKIFTVTFVIASGIAGLGGALNAPMMMVGPYMGFDMLLLSFITVIFGGLGSVKGTALSALIMGQVMSLGGTLWSPLAFIAPFLVMFIVILVRPNGLFGVKGASYAG